MRTSGKRELRPVVLPSEKNRLLELRFYFILKEMFQKPNVNALLLIETLAPVFNYNQDIILDLARKIYLNKANEIAPGKYEQIIMLYRLGMPVKLIMRKLRTHGSTLYKVLDQYIEDFQPAYNSTQPDFVLKEIEKFVAGIYSIYECVFEGAY